MIKFTYNGKEIVCHLSNNNVQIVDSYKIRKSSDMISIIEFVKTEAEKLGFTYVRSNNSWLTEWKAHNYLYDHNIEQARTCSVDLNEDEGKFKLFCYSVLAFMYKE